MIKLFRLRATNGLIFYSVEIYYNDGTSSIVHYGKDHGTALEIYMSIDPNAKAELISEKPISNGKQG